MAYKRLRKSYRSSKRRYTGQTGPRKTILRARRIRALKQKMCCYKPEVKFQTLAIDRLIYNRSSATINLDEQDSLTSVNSLLFTIGVGTTANARIGDHIFLKSIGIRAIITPLCRTGGNPAIAAEDADNPLFIRMSLVAIQKVNVSGSYPNFLKVYGNTSPLCHIARYYDRSDLTVYYDKVFNLGPPSVAKSTDGAASDQRNLFFKKNIKFERKVILDDQITTGGIPKDNKNNLYWLCYAFRPGIPADRNVAALTGQIRVYFTDA